MNPIEYYSLSNYRETADGHFVGRFLGHFGPYFQLTAIQRKVRIVAQMLYIGIVMTLVGWGLQALTFRFLLTWGIPILVLSMVAIEWLMCIGLPTVDAPSVRTPEELAEHKRLLRRSSGPWWIANIPMGVCYLLGTGIALGFSFVWWKALYVLTVAYVLLVLLVSLISRMVRGKQLPG